MGVKSLCVVHFIVIVFIVFECFFLLLFHVLSGLVDAEIEAGNCFLELRSAAAQAPLCSSNIIVTEAVKPLSRYRCPTRYNVGPTGFLTCALLALLFGRLRRFLSTMFRRGLRCLINIARRKRKKLALHLCLNLVEPSPIQPQECCFTVKDRNRMPETAQLLQISPHPQHPQYYTSCCM